MHLAQLLGALQVNCVLDVGGHVGWYGDFLRRIGYRGRIVSFEPVLRNYEQLADRARGDGDWRIENCAVGDTEGPAFINVTVHPGMESLLETTEAARLQHGSQLDVEERQEVRVRRLDGGVLDDHLAGLHKPALLLKADTQGLDLEVVRGALGVLDLIGAVQLELSLRPAYVGSAMLTEGLTELASLGFEPTGIFSGYRDKQLLLHEVDCVFRRAGGAGAAGPPG